MGFPSVSDIADKVAGVLGTGPASPGAASAAPMKKVDATYINAGDIDDAQANKPGATALNHPNIYDPKLPVHFIHFGRFHTDGYDNYHHETLQDDKAGVLPDGNTGSRGIMFRAALEREAVLINAFVACAASIAQEMSASQGGNNAAGLLKGANPASLASNPLGGMSAVQNAAGAVSGLLGGNSGTSAAPDASQLKPYQTAVQTAGAKVNVTALPYVDMHQAGIDLHQAWLNFDSFVPSMAKPTPNKSGGGLFGNIPGSLSSLGLPSLGGAGDVIGTVTSVLFSMYDIYQGMYQNLRVKLEPLIRNQCYARSLEAIKGSQQPIFDVWSVSPDQSTPPPASKPDHQDKIASFQTGTPADNVVNKPLNTVNNTYDQGLNDVDSANNAANSALGGAEQSWDSFWNSPPQKQGPGQNELNAIIAAFADPTAVVFPAFVNTVKNVSSSVTEASFPLNILCKILGVIVPACCGMLGNIFVQLQDPAFIKGGITQDAFDAAGRVYIRTKLASLLLGTGILDSILGPLNSVMNSAQGIAGSALSGAQSGISSAIGAIPVVGSMLPSSTRPSVNNPKFSNITSQGVANKALGMADSLAGKDLDPILDFAMGSLHQEFQQTLSNVDQNSMVMEVFLGQLPLLVTSLVRNIFFPFWQLVVDKALGPLGAAANLASSPVANLMSSARDKTQDVKNAVQDLSSSITSQAGQLKKYGLDNNAGDLANQFLGSGSPDGGSSTPPPAAGAGFPGSARKTSCSVNPVQKPDYDQVDAIDSQLRIQ
ncbi:MAG: hypothetical protein JOZ48_02460 [Acidobacteriaceae bacterium]|nr:hypothetical protein [Acidobacteriaceae bacterium]